MKYNEGRKKILPSAATRILMAGSFYLLSKSHEELLIKKAYAILTEIGVVGTVIFGMLVFGESWDLLVVMCILLIVSGIVDLMVVSPE